MSDPLQGLWDRVQARLGAADPETAALMARISVNLATLTAAATVGNKIVDQDMAHLRAQVSNLNAEFQTALADEFRQWVTEKVALVIQGVLTVT